MRDGHLLWHCLFPILHLLLPSLFQASVFFFFHRPQTVNILQVFCLVYFALFQAILSKLIHCQSFSCLLQADDTPTVFYLQLYFRTTFHIFNMQCCAGKCLKIGLWQGRGTSDFQVLPISVLSILPPWPISSYHCEVIEYRVEKRCVQSAFTSHYSWMPTSSWLKVNSTWTSYCHLKLNIFTDKHLSTNFLFQIIFTLSMVSVSRDLALPRFQVSVRKLPLGQHTWSLCHPSFPLLQGGHSLLRRLMKKLFSSFYARAWQTLAQELNPAYHLLFVTQVLGTQAHLFLYLLSMAVFTPQQQRQVVVTETNYIA